jgi:hypothetical protein
MEFPRSFTSTPAPAPSDQPLSAASFPPCPRRHRRASAPADQRCALDRTSPKSRHWVRSLRSVGVGHRATTNPTSGLSSRINLPKGTPVLHCARQTWSVWLLHPGPESTGSPLARRHHALLRSLFPASLPLGRSALRWQTALTLLPHNSLSTAEPLRGVQARALAMRRRPGVVLTDEPHPLIGESRPRLF